MCGKFGGKMEKTWNKLKKAISLKLFSSKKLTSTSSGSFDYPIDASQVDLKPQISQSSSSAGRRFSRNSTFSSGSSSRSRSSKMKKDTEHEIHNEVQLPGRLSGDDSSNLKMECCILEILCVLCLTKETVVMIPHQGHPLMLATAHGGTSALLVATGTHTSEDTDFSRWFADYPICE